MISNWNFLIINTGGKLGFDGKGDLYIRYALLINLR